MQGFLSMVIKMPLPSADQFTGSGVTEQGFKTAQTQLIEYLENEVPSTEFVENTVENKMSELKDFNKAIGQDIVIGSTDNTGATLNNVPSGTYVLNKPAAAGTVIRKVSLVSKVATGIATIKVFNLSGSTFNLNRTVATLSLAKMGLNEFDNLSIALNAGEYLAFSVTAGGVLSYIQKSTSTPSYYVDSNPNATSFAITSSNSGATAILQIAFHMFPNLEGIASAFTDIDGRVDGNTFTLDSVVGLQRFGVQYKPVFASGNANIAQWIPAKAATKDGLVTKFSTYATASGSVQVGIYKKSGTHFIRQRFVEINVDVGLNEIPIQLEFNAGEYIGLRTSVVGQTVYVSATSGHDGLYSTTSLDDDAEYTVNPNMNYAFQFTFDQFYSKLPASSLPTDAFNRWLNQVLATFGDSITWYFLQQFVDSHVERGQTCEGYQSAVKEILGCVIDNHGRSGWTMPQIYVGEISLFNFANTYATTITSGANDCRTGVAVGQITPIGSQFDKTTYAGALQASIEHVISSNPACKIFLITPIRGWYNEYDTTNVPNKDPNVVGLMNEAYANIMKDIGKLYGVPVLDWYNLTGLNEKNKFYYLGDDLSAFTAYLLHPKNKFFRIMGIILANFLKQY